jgi:HSP20 family protein
MIVRHRYPSTFDRTFDRSFDRVFEQLTSSLYDQRRVGPTVDGRWQEDRYVLTVDLPGIPADAVSVEVTGNTLTMSASTDSFQWQRSLSLGDQLDPDKIEARHVDGRLTVRVGTYDQPEPRRIAIDTSPAQPAIEAESSDQAESSEQAEG